MIMIGIHDDEDCDEDCDDCDDYDEDSERGS